MTTKESALDLAKFIKSRGFTVLAVVLFGVFAAIAFAASNASAINDKYISMSTLDFNLTSDHYFQEASHTLHTGDEMRWNIDVYNHMGQAEYVLVRAKLLDAAQAAPNDTSHNPAVGRVIFEKRTVIANNSTLLTPFDWTIAKVVPGQRGTGSLVVNGEAVNGFTAPVNGERLRMVFELWRYDVNQDEFAFSWPSDTGLKDVWNEIWFSIGT